MWLFCSGRTVTCSLLSHIHVALEAGFLPPTPQASAVRAYPNENYTGSFGIFGNGVGTFSLARRISVSRYMYLTHAAFEMISHCQSAFLLGFALW
jgi:hypothetical protein